MFYYLLCALLLAAVFGFIAFMGYHYRQFTGSAALLLASVPPLLLSLLTVLPWPIRWINKLKKRNYALAQSPYNQLTKIGFAPCYFNYHTIWHFTEISMSATIDGFTILFNIPDFKFKPDTPAVEFTPLVKKRKLKRHQLQHIEQKFDFSPVRFYDKKSSRFYFVNHDEAPSIDRLATDIKEFVSLLKDEKFEPGGYGTEPINSAP
ncbi:hypothetical protein [Mucilaginibacter paludis]|uniref:hypothetical protein n=1 Tax=Mucilaginibacter paludis TaxID=423351 RepID=UPI00145EC48D|nr:hypothetical protein [Mucilaginibacter paludis]